LSLKFKNFIHDEYPESHASESIEILNPTDGKAYAEALGARLVDKAKLLMPNGMRLWTFQSNVRAHKFYEHHGFVVLERTDGRHNEEQSPDVCYEWKPTAT
jgi:GNAT superfamily N-acetyltransferase